MFLFVLVVFLGVDLTRHGIYSSKVGINIAVVGDNGVSLLILRPEEEMVSWVKLPKNIRIKIYNSDASYPLESVWSYGVAERKPYEIVEKSLGQSMGIIVSRTIKVEDHTLIENVLSKILSLGTKTDLSIKDRLMIRNFLVNSVSSKKILEQSILTNIFDKVVDPDGKEFFEFNKAVNLWTKNKFVIESILNENAYISINNISGKSGLGSVLANQLDSSGMHVIEVKADSSEIVDESKDCVFTSEKRFVVTEMVLAEQLGCMKILRPKSIEADDKIRIWIKN